MGKHSRGGVGEGPSRDDRRRRVEGSQRRVPSERRRTPGERSASLGESEYVTQLPDPSARRRGSLEGAPERLRSERDRRRSRSKRIIAIVAGVVAVLLIATVAGAAGYAYKIQHTFQAPIKKDEKLSLDLTPAQAGKPFTVLFLGADYRKGDTAYRTDTMIVAKVDPQAKKVWMISIPRDTRVLIPGHGYDKINAAHFYGGPDLAVKTVENFTGVKINHYMEVNFQGFEAVVNALGGVWMNVPVAIYDKSAASQSVHQRAAKIPSGWQKLDGEHALTFVRARHQFADQDFSRMKDQQLFAKAVADQIAKPANLPKLPAIISAAAPYLQTDMNLMGLLRTAMAMRSAGSKNVYTATVLGNWKTPYIYPDDTLKEKLVADMESGLPFDKKQAAAEAAAAAAATTSTATSVSAVKPAAITITIRNGSGVSGVAKQAGMILKARGFNVKTVGNAGQNVYKTTMVVYKKNLAAANAVAAQLMPDGKVVASRGMYSYPTEILVVVGRDWDVSQIPAAPVNTPVTTQ